MEIVREVVQSVLSFSSDAVVILLIIAGLSAYTFIMGKEKGVSLLISFYPSALLFKYLPFLKQYTDINPTISSQALSQVLIFLFILSIVHIVMNKVISLESSYSKVRNIFDSIIIGISTSGILILFSYYIINIKSFYNFSEGIDTLFASNFIFYWLFAPFIILYFIKK